MDGQKLTVAKRIRRRAEYERIYGKGERLHGRFMTVFILPTDKLVPRLGVAATRKLGTAVQRNRAKRLARELFRGHKNTSSYDVVVVPRREMLDAPFSRLEADYSSLLRRGRKNNSLGAVSNGKSTRARIH